MSEYMIWALAIGVILVSITVGAVGGYYTGYRDGSKGTK